MKKNSLKILIVEDDELSRISLENRLLIHGCVQSFNNSKEANIALSSNKFDLVFIDLDLESSLAGLNILKKCSNDTSYKVIVSAREENEIVSQAYELGCHDFMAKPFKNSTLESVMNRFYQNYESLADEIKKMLLAKNDNLDSLIKNIEASLLSQDPVFISGETGVGKTHLAKFLHQKINSDQPFVHLNCAEISENLVESELFGHEKGAFTGAQHAKKGLIELADGGILFLDEIGTLTLAVQRKLLKVLEEKVFTPLGSEKAKRSHFRLISATCEDLQLKLENGDFRQDFYFRMMGHKLHIPSLQERKKDFDYILMHFLKSQGRRISISVEARNCLYQHQWPGNIRELQRVVYQLSEVRGGLITEKNVKEVLENFSVNHSSSNKRHLDFELIQEIGLPNYLEKLEAEIIEAIWVKNNQKVRKTLLDLKISNNTFYKAMASYKQNETNSNEQFKQI